MALFSLRSPESQEAPFPEWADDVWDAAGGGTFLAGTFTSFETGPLVSTDNPFDFALGGKGFFTISDGANTYYTRSGNFALDDSGRLVTEDHKYQVMSSSGGSITLDPSRADEVSVSPGGTVTQGDTTVGTLAVVDFADKTQLRKMGENRFIHLGSQASSSPGAEARVANHALEGSSANAIREMVAMIEASRAYELNIRMVQAQDTTLSRVANDVGRLPT